MAYEHDPYESVVMTGKDLDFFKGWFFDYSNSFRFDDEKARKNIVLKQKHTCNVCRNIAFLAKASGLNGGKVILAEAIALFHDIGRFKQFAVYGTFNDAISVNHGLLGSTILSEQGVLKSLSEEEQETILYSVKLHNTLTLPDLSEGDKLLFLKLIRDSDKLDIWSIFIEYRETPQGERASAAGLGLQDTPGYSANVLSSVFKKQLVTFSNLKTLDDFTLMQLSWIYDLNFKASLGLVLERSYIERLLAKLPQTEEIRKISPLLMDYAHQRLRENNPV